jgi:hypothetical protein
MALLVIPVICVVGLPNSITVRGLVLAMLQLSPVALAVAYLQYAETHRRILFFGFERPSITLVFVFVALLQVLVSALVV